MLRGPFLSGCTDQHLVHSGNISRLYIFCMSDKMTVRFDQGLGRSAQTGKAHSSIPKENDWTTLVHWRETDAGQAGNCALSGTHDGCRSVRGRGTSVLSQGGFQGRNIE